MKKIKKIIPDKAMAILVIVFALSMLIGGGGYLFAVVTYPLPQVAPSNPLTAAAWNNMVDDINDLNNWLSSSPSLSLVCNRYPRSGSLTCDQICISNNETCVFGADEFNGTPGPNFGVWGSVYRCGMADSTIDGCTCCRISW